MKASLKPLILINICILILFFACSLPGVKGSGKVERENRTIGSFNELHVSGMFDVYMREGNTPSVEVVADDNLLPIIRTELKGSRLKVYTDENIRSSTKLKLLITYTELEAVYISGAVKLRGKSTIVADHFDINVSGAAEMELDLKVDHLSCDLSGASDMLLTGIANHLRIDGSGAMNLDAYELETSSAKIDLSGAGECKISVNESLDVDLSGAATVRYKGSPAKIKQDISGAGSIKRVGD